ncbi:hypothetical protein [Escherichia coli]|uniref:hypothetical protein n=1 Tax=Escherichia coli TaxID=562 RepID=UPI0030D328CB
MAGKPKPAVFYMKAAGVGWCGVLAEKYRAFITIGSDVGFILGVYCFLKKTFAFFKIKVVNHSWGFNFF